MSTYLSPPREGESNSVRWSPPSGCLFVRLDRSSAVSSLDLSAAGQPLLVEELGSRSDLGHPIAEA
jgi:hypothetical protein